MSGSQKGTGVPIYFSPEACYIACRMCLFGRNPTVALFLAFFFGYSAIGLGADPAAGTLEITLAPAENVEPSYQIAIWLEKENGELAKTLFVSDYLAYAGFNDPTICPAWLKIANWEQATDEEFDAVSRPTPPLGEVTLTVNCKERGIEPGTYYYAVQVHIVEDFNIAYRGKITIGTEPTNDQAVAHHTPGKYENAENVIHSVSARYLPAENEVQKGTNK